MGKRADRREIARYMEYGRTAREAGRDDAMAGRPRRNVTLSAQYAAGYDEIPYHRDTIAPTETADEYARRVGGNA